MTNYVLAIDIKYEFNLKGVAYGVLTGIAYGIGCFWFLLAVEKGNIAIVVTATGLYPLVTILLCYIILHENLTNTQVLGMCFAILAIYFMSK